MRFNGRDVATHRLADPTSFVVVDDHRSGNAKKTTKSILLFTAESEKVWFYDQIFVNRVYRVEFEDGDEGDGDGPRERGSRGTRRRAIIDPICALGHDRSIRDACCVRTRVRRRGVRPASDIGGAFFERSRRNCREIYLCTNLPRPDTVHLVCSFEKCSPMSQPHFFCSVLHLVVWE